MPNAEKAKILDAATEGLRGAPGVYLADFSGMDVAKLTMLRKQCREQRVKFQVVKNTLLKRAFTANGITGLDDFLNGPTGVVYSMENGVAPAKILSDFAKQHERPRIKAALIDGRLFDEKAISELAALPSREVLLAQVLATIIAPLTTFLSAVEATVALPAVMADVLERERTPAN